MKHKEEKVGEKGTKRKNFKLWAREFPGSPVVRTQCFHCRAWVQSLVRELRSRKLHGTAKKKKAQKTKTQQKTEMVGQYQGEDRE